MNVLYGFVNMSRLMLGVDNFSGNEVRIITSAPTRLNVDGANNWPIWTLTLKPAPGERIANLRVRMPSQHGYLWLANKNLDVAQITAH